MTYRSRTLTRLIVSPPTLLRKCALLVKKLTGPFGRLLHRVALKTVRLLSAPGYKSEIGAELRDEIRRYYAEDNKLLEERLRRSSASLPTAVSTPRRACLNSDSL
jgi:hypothetical protein